MGPLGAPEVDRLKAARDVSGLIRALGHGEDGEIREAAARALGQIGDRGAVEALVAALQDEDSRIRKAAAGALDKIGDPADERLLPAPEHPSQAPRKGAVTMARQAAGYRTVSVFISSTFRDMQAERDHLVRFVFPKLREQLLSRRIHLVDMDLRWGVTGDQNALSVCREVVDECHPRFLCMLGGRYGWVPPGEVRSITADEIHYGVLDHLGHEDHALFYFRDPTATAAMVEETPGEYREPTGSEKDRSLTGLKQTIERAGYRPFVYPAHWDDKARRLVGLRAFGERVYADLNESIDEAFGEQALANPDEFTEEQSAMDAFIGERTQRFILGGREPVWRELVEYTTSAGESGCLCLVGKPGSGKSALLANFAVSFPGFAPTESLLITHFVGASPGSTDVRQTLRRLCHELTVGGGIATEIPHDPDGLRTAFPRILEHACEKNRVVIILDAVDQFDHDPMLDKLCWLEQDLPGNARVILSSQLGRELDDLRERLNRPREVMLRGLAPRDRKAIIRQFLHRYRKATTAQQTDALRAKTDAATPLYLLAALEELRTLGTYEEITDRITQLPGTTQALFTWILKRLEEDDGFRDASDHKIGRQLVAGFASLLGVSRHGLSQCELVELLAPSDFEAEPAAPADAQGNVASLVQLLRPYLMHRGKLLDFYHGQFREAVKAEYLEQESKRQVAHTALASYFLSQAQSVSDGTWKGEVPRGFSELLFHLRSAGMWDEICSCMKDPEIFAHLSPSVYGVDFDHGVYVTPDPDGPTPGSLADLRLEVRSRVGHEMAVAFATHARSRLRQTRAFKQPWPETAQYLREHDAEGFAAYRDAFYSFTRLAGKSAEFGIAAFEGSQNGRRKWQAFLDENAGLTSFLHYLVNFGSDETGLSHALEDDAYPSLDAWEKLRHLVAS